MASVFLRFTPPDRPGIVKLNIFEYPTPLDAPTRIEQVVAVGEYPTYIDNYTTDVATDINHWFSIQWEDEKGALTDMSELVQGGTETAVASLVDRVKLRDPGLNEIVITQEVEAVLETYFKVDDPYSIDLETISYKTLSGLTNLTLARAYLTQALVNSASAVKFTAGIIALDNTASTNPKSPETLKALIELANRDLDLNYSYIMLLKEVKVAGGYTRLAGVDISRSLAELQ